MANENTIQATGTFITRKGLNLITKLVAAKGTLSFSRAAVGTGKPPEGYSPDSMISLSSYKMDAEIADYGTQEDKAYVTMQVSSDQVEEGFLLTEVGLYATDPDEGEILYAYMDISTDPTYIYANGSANRTKYAEFTLYVLIGTVEKVTAAVTPGSIITKETFKASNLPVIDTHGIMGDSGSTVMSQELFDAVAEKIVNELVSNEKLNTVLTEKLADYIMKSKIVNHLLATDESTVLSGPMGKELKGLLDVLNTKISEKNNQIRYQTRSDDADEQHILSDGLIMGSNEPTIPFDCYVIAHHHITLKSSARNARVYWMLGGAYIQGTESWDGTASQEYAFDKTFIYEATAGQIIQLKMYDSNNVGIISRGNNNSLNRHSFIFIPK